MDQIHTYLPLKNGILLEMTRTALENAVPRGGKLEMATSR